jgi:hypothetical protein
MTMTTDNAAGGPARAYVDVSGTDTEVGHLFGGIDAEFAESAVFDLHVDELGETPVNGVFNGSGPDFLTIRLAEITLDNLKLAIPNGRIVTDGTTPSKKRFEIIKVAGTTLAALSKKWTIKPIDTSTGLPTTDKNLWLVVPKGTAVGAVHLAYKVSEQRVIEVRIRCLPELVGTLYRTAYVGDGTAVAA